MTVQWSPQQVEALDKCFRWLDAKPGTVPQFFYIAGFAGSGKTLLAHEINKHIGGTALAGAYTGKAASVLRRRGLLNAATVHSLAYTPIGNDLEAKHKELKEELKGLEDFTGANREQDVRTVLRLEALRRQLASIEDDASNPRFTLKAREESALTDCPLLILDEVSQIDTAMAEDLLSFGCRILILGDPGQLPPIRGEGYFTSKIPDVFLTEIHRQAADNPIIRLATLAREGKSIPYGEWTSESGAARVVRRVEAEEALRADMRLCGTNAKRQAINRRHRVLDKFDGFPMPQVGEPLMCLRNNKEIGLYNGTLWGVAQADSRWTTGEDTVYLQIAPEEGGIAIGVPCEATLFFDDQAKMPFCRNEMFTFGYAATVHKAQGSQWENTMVFDDWPSNRSYKEWLYTALTRAATELTLVRS